MTKVRKAEIASVIYAEVADSWTEPVTAGLNR